MIVNQRGVGHTVKSVTKSYMKPNVHLNVCEKTILHNPDGTAKEKRKKKQFDNLEDAITEAKRINNKPTQHTKAVAYKCETCFKYHVGRNGNPLKRDRK